MMRLGTATGSGNGVKSACDSYLAGDSGDSVLNSWAGSLGMQYSAPCIPKEAEGRGRSDATHDGACCSARARWMRDLVHL
jgi:hypothetical protein